MDDKQKLTDALMADPSIMASLEERMKMAIGKTSGLIESYPNEVQRRIKALKNLNKQHVEIEHAFNKEVAELEKKYLKLYTPLFDQRTEIVSGAREPTEEEADYESEEEDEEEMDEEEKALAKAIKDAKASTAANAAPVTGIPDFWVTAIQNHEAIREMVQEHDVPILHYLKDIRMNYLDGDLNGYELTFEFNSNEYFTNSVLTKTYLVDQFDEYERLEGCTINWNADKDVTCKKIKKKQRNKSTGQVRTTVKTEPCESFFNFFAPPTIPSDDDDELDEETQNAISMDIEAGESLKDQIIPQAVLWFTGEAVGDYDDEDYEDEDEDEDDEDEDEDGDDDDDEDDDEKDPNFDPTKKPETPAECKQQ